MGLNATPTTDRLHIGFFGKRNAGKSSVVNAFTNQNLSIVSDIKGTTTDPVYKAMELLPLGPVMIIDTPGLDDVGQLGDLRVKKCMEVMRKVDAALLVVDSTTGFSKEDYEIYDMLYKRAIPTLIVMNKSDLCEDFGRVNDLPSAQIIFVSALENKGIDKLRQMTAVLAGVNEDKDMQKCILPNFIKENSVVLLVVPIDEAAPKGRIILPQQQVLRACLDKGAQTIVCKDTELENTLKKFDGKIDAVITDSQVFNQVSKLVPQDIPMTGFSIVLSAYKGDLDWQVEGADTIDKIEDGDKVLITEACTHRRQCNDIGTVKIPNMIKKYTGKNVSFDYCSGNDFISDTDILKKYRLVIHCGGCMINEREMQFRVGLCRDAGVPMTNYGIAIAKMNGILERATKIFTL